MSIPYRIYTPALLEPTLLKPSPNLENMALEMVRKSAGLHNCLHPNTIASIGKLIQSMNCYYSNLIEGHVTKLADIERAIAGDYATDPQKRDLQLEAKAHIEVQFLVDKRLGNRSVAPTAGDFLGWIHQEFYDRLQILLWTVEGKAQVQPGVYRDRNVVIGLHVPPPPDKLAEFMAYFDRVYGNPNLGGIDRILASAAAHHRLLWIHPFLDGNGRVARIFSHTYLGWAGVENRLWSGSRGLARQVQKYRELLAIADQQRLNDYDGRGNLSLAGLTTFTEFFLATCLDQIEFMQSRLQLDKLLARIEFWTVAQIKSGQIKTGAFPLLKAALLEGSVARNQAALITGREERQARTILKSLTDKGVLASSAPRGDVSLQFIAEVVDDWLPGLI